MAANNVNHWLRFEFQSSHVIENCNNTVLTSIRTVRVICVLDFKGTVVNQG